jgi:hypothetical protein
MKQKTPISSDDPFPHPDMASWLVIDMRKQASQIHVVPKFGADHEMEEDCWCNPELEHHESMLVVHRVEN